MIGNWLMLVLWTAYSPPPELSQLAAAWGGYMAWCERLQGSVTRNQGLVGSPPSKTFRYDLKQSPFGVVFGMWVNQRETVRVHSQSYGFELQRDFGQEWKVTHVGSSKEDAEELRLLSRTYTAYGLALWGASNFLPTMIQEPDFRLTKCEPLMWNGRRAAALTFTRGSAKPHAGRIAAGRILALPDKHWLLVEFDVIQEYIDPSNRPTRNPMMGRVDYVDLDVPYPIIRRHWIRFEEAGIAEGPPTITLDFDFKPGSPENSEFTLTAFGLPEPFGVTWDRPTPWWLYALNSAGVLFVVAVIVSFWKRRLAARQAA